MLALERTDKLVHVEFRVRDLGGKHQMQDLCRAPNNVRKFIKTLLVFNDLVKNLGQTIVRRSQCWVLVRVAKLLVHDVRLKSFLEDVCYIEN